MIQSEFLNAEIMKMTGRSQLKTFLRYVNLTKETAGASALTFSNYLQDKFALLKTQSLDISSK